MLHAKGKPPHGAAWKIVSVNCKFISNYEPFGIGRGGTWLPCQFVTLIAAATGRIRYASPCSDTSSIRPVATLFLQVHQYLGLLLVHRRRLAFV